MKSNTLSLLLCLAPAALGAAIPIVLIQDLEPVPAAPTQPAQRSQQADSQVSATKTALPGVRPLAAAYLMALAKGHKERPTTVPETDDVEVFDSADVVVFDTSRTPKNAIEIEAVRSSTTAQFEIGIQQNTKTIGIPCYLAHLRRDYTDMLAISLVATFLLIIVVVETWDAVCQK